MIKFRKVGEVVSFPPAQIRRAILAEFPPDASLPGSFNWKILAEAASLYAHEASDRGAADEAYEWSALGIETYERLSRERRENDFIRDAMRLRHNLLIYCGPRPGDPFADPFSVESMFLKTVPWSLAQTRERILQPPELGSDDDLTLFELSERLELIQSLVAKGLLSNQGEIASWLALGETLPK